MIVYYKKTGRYHSVAKKVDDDTYKLYTDDTLTDTHTVKASQLVIKNTKDFQ